MRRLFTLYIYVFPYGHRVMYVRCYFLVQPPNCSFDEAIVVSGQAMSIVQLRRKWVSRVTLPKIDPLRRSSARHECVCDLLRHPRNDLCLEYEGQRGVSRPLSPSSFLILIRDKAHPARPYIVWLSPTVGHTQIAPPAFLMFWIYLCHVPNITFIYL